MIQVTSPGNGRAGRQGCCLCRPVDQIQNIQQATDGERIEAGSLQMRRTEAFYQSHVVMVTAVLASDGVLQDATETNTFELHDHQLQFSTSYR